MHHSSATPELPLRLQHIMDSAISFVDIEDEGNLSMEEESSIKNTKNVSGEKRRRSKIAKVIMKDEEV